MQNIFEHYPTLILPIIIRVLICRGIFIIVIPPVSFIKDCRFFSLCVSCFCFPLAIILWAIFDNRTSSYQFVFSFFQLNRLNLDISLGIDGISLFFVLLTRLLTPLCLLCCWDSISTNKRSFIFGAFLIIEGVIFVIFSSLDVLTFYIFFEAILTPIFFLVGIYGSRVRRVKAAYYFFLYTFFGSLFILFGILLLYYSMGTTDYLVLQRSTSFLSLERERILWVAFFFGFAVKVPIMPVHLWLPEAHVEAPTAGSVFLAGILLKLGTYGLVRFSFGFFPIACLYFSPLVNTVALLSVIYASFTAIRQKDIKRVIAYASVAHINFTILGLFSINLQGFEGSIFQIISHGVVSSGLFLCIGVIYDRYGTRLISYYSGLSHLIPIYSVFFLCFILGNIAFPGTSSFIGEFFILLGLAQKNRVLVVLRSLSVVLSGCYSLWLFNRIFYGNFIRGLAGRKDLNRREFAYLLPLGTLTVLIGIFPRVFIAPMHSSVRTLLYVI